MARLLLLTSIAILGAAIALGFGLRIGDYIQQPLSLVEKISEPASDPQSPSPVRCDEADIKVVTYDPLIVHFSQLVSPEERAYLKRLAEPLLQKSTVILDGKQVEDVSRTSSSAFLPRDDPIVQRLADRVQKFQGYMEVDHIDLQVTSYQEGQQYVPHFDWYHEVDRDVNRFSTFFATLEADCDNCGTHFPELRMDWSRRDSIWCQWFDCTQDFLTTKNIPGSALYWRNLDEELKPRLDVLHAGLPAVGGHKMGLNIWTEVRLHRPVVEEASTGNSTSTEEYDVQNN